MSTKRPSGLNKFFSRSHQEYRGRFQLKGSERPRSRPCRRRPLLGRPNGRPTLTKVMLYLSRSLFYGHFWYPDYNFTHLPIEPVDPDGLRPIPVLVRVISVVRVVRVRFPQT